jgi:glycosyltransferase involved in cell wall biosynthesis
MALLKSQGFPVRLAVCCHSFAPAVLADLCIFRDWLDLMVGVNQLQLRVLTEMGVKADICRHIPCTAQHEPTGLERKEKTGPLHLVYVGRFEQTEKRVLDVLKLCGELEANNCEYRLSLVGDGSCRAELQAALAQQIAAGWVQWVGWCDRLKLAEEVYPRSDVLLLFSPSETGPIVAWEAMSHGVVPVVSDFRGRAAEGVIRQGQTGLVFPVGDMRTAAARIRELDKDRTRLSFLSQRARAAVADRADPARTTAAWLEALEATLRRPMRTGVLPDVAKHPGGGRLECWGVPPQWADCLRRWSGRQPEPIDPGAEWPHHGPGDPDLEAAIERALVEHDVEPAVRASASAIQESRLAAS